MFVCKEKKGRSLEGLGHKENNGKEERAAESRSGSLDLKNMGKNKSTFRTTLGITTTTKAVRGFHASSDPHHTGMGLGEEGWAAGWVSP